MDYDLSRTTTDCEELGIKNLTLTRDGYIVNNQIHLTTAQWQGVTVRDGGRYHCCVCNLPLLSLPLELVKHVRSEDHFGKLSEHRPMRKYSLSVTRFIDDQYYCSVCNELRKMTADIDDHFTTKMHRDNLNTALYRGVVYSNLFSDKNQDEISNTESLLNRLMINNEITVTRSKLDYFSVTVGETVIYVDYNHWNMVMHSENKYNCMSCNFVGRIVNIFIHLESADHRLMLSYNRFLPEFGEHLIRNVDLIYSHCTHCNELIVTQEISEHIESKNHTERIKINCFDLTHENMSSNNTNNYGDQVQRTIDKSIQEYVNAQRTIQGTLYIDIPHLNMALSAFEKVNKRISKEIPCYPTFEVIHEQIDTDLDQEPNVSIFRVPNLIQLNKKKKTIGVFSGGRHSKRKTTGQKVRMWRKNKLVPFTCSISNEPSDSSGTTQNLTSDTFENASFCQEPTPSTLQKSHQDSTDSKEIEVRQTTKSSTLKSNLRLESTHCVDPTQDLSEKASVNTPIIIDPQVDTQDNIRNPSLNPEGTSSDMPGLEQQTQDTLLSDSIPIEIGESVETISFYYEETNSDLSLRCEGMEQDSSDSDTDSPNTTKHKYEPLPEESNSDNLLEQSSSDDCESGARHAQYLNLKKLELKDRSGQRSSGNTSANLTPLPEDSSLMLISGSTNPVKAVPHAHSFPQMSQLLTTHDEHKQKEKAERNLAARKNVPIDTDDNDKVLSIAYKKNPTRSEEIHSHSSLISKSDSTNVNMLVSTIAEGESSNLSSIPERTSHDQNLSQPAMSQRPQPYPETSSQTANSRLELIQAQLLPLSESIAILHEVTEELTSIIHLSENVVMESETATQTTPIVVIQSASQDIQTPTTDEIEEQKHLLSDKTNVSSPNIEMQSVSQVPEGSEQLEAKDESDKKSSDIQDDVENTISNASLVTRGISPPLSITANQNEASQILHPHRYSSNEAHRFHSLNVSRNNSLDDSSEDKALSSGNQSSNLLSQLEATESEGTFANISSIPLESPPHSINVAQPSTESPRKTENQKDTPPPEIVRVVALLEQQQLIDVPQPAMSQRLQSSPGTSSQTEHSTLEILHAQFLILSESVSIRPQLSEIPEEVTSNILASENVAMTSERETQRTPVLVLQSASQDSQSSTTDEIEEQKHLLSVKRNFRNPNIEIQSMSHVPEGSEQLADIQENVENIISNASLVTRGISPPLSITANQNQVSQLLHPHRHSSNEAQRFHSLNVSRNHSLEDLSEDRAISSGNLNSNLLSILEATESEGTFANIPSLPRESPPPSYNVAQPSTARTSKTKHQKDTLPQEIRRVVAIVKQQLDAASSGKEQNEDTPPIEPRVDTPPIDQSVDTPSLQQHVEQQLINQPPVEQRENSPPIYSDSLRGSPSHKSLTTTSERTYIAPDSGVRESISCDPYEPFIPIIITYTKESQKPQVSTSTRDCVRNDPEIRGSSSNMPLNLSCQSVNTKPLEKVLVKKSEDSGTSGNVPLILGNTDEPISDSNKDSDFEEKAEETRELVRPPEIRLIKPDETGAILLHTQTASRGVPFIPDEEREPTPHIREETALQNLTSNNKVDKIVASNYEIGHVLLEDNPERISINPENIPSNEPSHRETTIGDTSLIPREINEPRPLIPQETTSQSLASTSESSNRGYYEADISGLEVEKILSNVTERLSISPLDVWSYVPLSPQSTHDGDAPSLLAEITEADIKLAKSLTFGDLPEIISTNPEDSNVSLPPEIETEISESITRMETISQSGASTSNSNQLGPYDHTDIVDAQIAHLLVKPTSSISPDKTSETVDNTRESSSTSSVDIYPSPSSNSSSLLPIEDIPVDLVKTPQPSTSQTRQKSLSVPTIKCTAATENKLKEKDKLFPKEQSSFELSPSNTSDNAPLLLNIHEPQPSTSQTKQTSKSSFKRKLSKIPILKKIRKGLVKVSTISKPKSSHAKPETTHAKAETTHAKPKSSHAKAKSTQAKPKSTNAVQKLLMNSKSQIHRAYSEFRSIVLKASNDELSYNVLSSGQTSSVLVSEESHTFTNAARLEGTSSLPEISTMGINLDRTIVNVPSHPKPTVSNAARTEGTSNVPETSTMIINLDRIIVNVPSHPKPTVSNAARTEGTSDVPETSTMIINLDRTIVNVPSHPGPSSNSARIEGTNTNEPFHPEATTSNETSAWKKRRRVYQRSKSILLTTDTVTQLFEDRNISQQNEHFSSSESITRVDISSVSSLDMDVIRESSERSNRRTDTIDGTFPILSFSPNVSVMSSFRIQLRDIIRYESVVDIRYHSIRTQLRSEYSDNIPSSEDIPITLSLRISRIISNPSDARISYISIYNLLYSSIDLILGSRFIVPPIEQSGTNRPIESPFATLISYSNDLLSDTNTTDIQRMYRNVVLSSYRHRSLIFTRLWPNTIRARFSDLTRSIDSYMLIIEDMVDPLSQDPLSYLTYCPDHRRITNTIISTVADELWLYKISFLPHIFRP